ncbi:MAG: Rrf2 family transcriptional regulator [Acidobacteriota bacterium]
MNLSTRGRYATRAMLELAQHYDQAPVSSTEISRNQQISARYLQQLLGTLKRAGLIRVALGPGGGFKLAAPPSEIRLSQILDAVEGRLALVECVSHESYCPRSPDCLAREIWVQASELLNDYFHSLTLADVLKSRSKPKGRSACGKPFRAKRLCDLHPRSK